MNSLLPLGAGLLLCLMFAFWLAARISRRNYLARLYCSEAFDVAELVSPPCWIQPLRRTLRPKDAPCWRHPRAMDLCAQTLEALGYEHVADYTVDQFQGQLLRAYFCVEAQLYVVIHDDPHAHLYAEVCCDLEDGSHLCISGEPPDGFDVPPFLHLEQLDLDLAIEPDGVANLHAQALRVLAGRTPRAASAASFGTRFERLYARVMDWRIQRGGPSADELRRVMAIRGRETPDDEHIVELRQQWLRRVPGFLDEEAVEAFVQTGGMSEGEWERKKSRLLVVHDFSEVEPLVQRIGAAIGIQHMGIEDRARALTRIRRCFDAVPVRHGFAAAQALVPGERRYVHVRRIESEWMADLYLVPLPLAAAA